MTSSNDIQVDISGSDYDTLTQIANDLTEQIAALEDTEEVTNSWRIRFRRCRFLSIMRSSAVWADFCHHRFRGSK